MDTDTLIKKRQKIGRDVRAHRKARHLTLVQLEEITGIDNGNLSKIERGVQSLTNDSMIKLSEAFGIELKELFSDDSSESGTVMASKGRAHNSAKPITFYASLKDIPEGVSVVIDSISALQAVDPSGAPTWCMNHAESAVFNGDRLRTITSRPVSMASHKIKDDSMQPRLYAGDHVAIDTADQEIPDGGGVFGVIIDGRTISIRRLFSRPGGGIMITCDNHNYPALQLSPEEVRMIAIVGRVKTMSSNAGF